MIYLSETKLVGVMRTYPAQILPTLVFAHWRLMVRQGPNQQSNRYRAATLKVTWNVIYNFIPNESARVTSSVVTNFNAQIKEI